MPIPPTLQKKKKKKRCICTSFGFDPLPPSKDVFFYWFSWRFSTFGRYLEKKIIFPLEKSKILKIFPQFWSSDQNPELKRGPLLGVYYCFLYLFIIFFCKIFFCRGKLYYTGYKIPTTIPQRHFSPGTSRNICRIQKVPGLQETSLAHTAFFKERSEDWCHF